MPVRMSLSHLAHEDTPDKRRFVEQMTAFDQVTREFAPDIKTPRFASYIFDAFIPSGITAEEHMRSMVLRLRGMALDAFWIQPTTKPVWLVVPPKVLNILLQARWLKAPPETLEELRPLQVILTLNMTNEADQNRIYVTNEAPTTDDAKIVAGMTIINA